MEEFSPPRRVNTDTALRQAQEYQLERLIPPSIVTNSIDEGEESLNRRMERFSSLSANVDEQFRRRSATSQRSSSAEAPGNWLYSHLHYTRILASVICVQSLFEIIFVLAVGGVFGKSGSYIAIGFLLFLLLLAFLGIIDGVRQRMQDVERENTEVRKES